MRAAYDRGKGVFLDDGCMCTASADYDMIWSEAFLNIGGSTCSVVVNSALAEGAQLLRNLGILTRDDELSCAFALLRVRRLLSTTVTVGCRVSRRPDPNVSIPSRSQAVSHT
jgi:hypothetical protein